jgi:dihydrofolate reductase
VSFVFGIRVFLYQTECKMKTIVVFVTTLDGKITKWNDPHVMRWSSAEDQAYFRKIWNESPLIVMGSRTFDFDPIKPSPKSLLHIMSWKPARYNGKEVPGQLTFSDESPEALVARFQTDYEQMLVVGGPTVATAFFQAGLVDELWLTLEPKIFGEGGNFAVGAELDINLSLISMEKVNDRGTLILKYRVLKS